MEWKALREKAGLKQSELVARIVADGVRFDAPLLSKIECGIVHPGAQLDKALRKHLQVAESAENSNADTLDDVTPAAAQKGDYTDKLSEIIPEGEDNAVTRTYLTIKLGLSDREVRKAIEAARADGLLICNAQDGRGYFQTKDVAFLKAQYRQDTARAMAILKRRKPLRDYLKAQGEDV